jgi:endoglucanase
MRFPRGPRISRLARLIAVSSLTVAAGAVAVVSSVGVGTAVAAPSTTGEFNYAEALQDSMFFYEIQRSGPTTSTNRVTWRGPSDMSDGSDVGVDLTGGYHDAGDEVKFGFPEAYAMTTLAWGYLADPAGYTKAGQTQYLLNNLRWGDDYIIKAHTAPHVFYGQVGTGALDHNFWGPAEVNPTVRQSFAITETCPGSDLLGEAAAAMAASSMVFQSTDATYAATLLAQAKSLYSFGDSFRGKYSDCISDAANFYKSFSGYWDELVWGALWLYKATGDTTYLTKAESYFANLPTANQSTTPEYAYTLNWDDKSFGDYILLAEITGQSQYITAAENNLDWLTVGFNGTKPTYTPGGEVQVGSWGPTRYASNAAFTALEFSKYLKAQNLDPTRQTTYHNFAVQQANYILGDNPNKESYEIGFTNSGTSTNWPQFPHHRTAHGSWDQSMTDPPYTRHTAYGLLVGGPTNGTDTFTDDRSQYQQTEGALDYSSLFSGLLAGLTDQYGGTPRANFPPTETPDGPEIYSAASINQAGTNFIEIKSQTYNKSSWPARALTTGHLRYYFTLDPGETISQVTVAFVYHECPNISVAQFSGSTYYVDVDCTGQVIAPAGQSAWHRENQFRITFPAAHDYTKDFSFTGVGAQNTTPVTVNDMPVYQGTTKIWGNDPGPAVTVNPPSAPGTPTASAITASGVTLTWTAATAGTNAIGGYDVYKVGSPDSIVASTTGALTAAVTGLSSATAYQFYVVARDTSGNNGPKSGTVSVTTANPPANSPPGAPGTPTASSLTATGVTLTWAASAVGSNPVSKYTVFQTATSGDVAVGSTANGTTTSLALTNLTPSTSYTFYVVATDSAGLTSPHSGTVAVTTPAQPVAGACHVAYTTNDWGTGFTANFTITNTGTVAWTTWTLTFKYTGNQTLTNGWSATWSQSGENFTGVALSYNGALAPGANTTAGFNANYSGTNTAPSSFAINGVTCT